MLNLENWNLDSIQELMKASRVPILGVLGHVIVNWVTKNIKKQRLLAWKFINSPITQKALGEQSWNLNKMWILKNSLCKPGLRAPGHVTKMLQAKNWQKVGNFESIFLGLYRFWLKTICDFWEHYQPSFLWLSLFTPTWILFFFSFFFRLFFFFFLNLHRKSTFKLLNALY